MVNSSNLSVNDEHLVIIVNNTVMQVWYLFGDTIKPIKIDGEEQINVKEPEDINSSFKEAVNQLGSGGNTYGYIHWILDSKSFGFINQDVFKEVIEYHQNKIWQILRWEWLDKQLNLDRFDESKIRNQLLPWLFASNSQIAYERKMSALDNKYNEEADKVNKDIMELKKVQSLYAIEKKRLEAEIQALKKVDPDLLLSYLPALFPRVFTRIGATDLALLCGRTEPLNIPNPYPEPTDETLLTKQKRFISLPIEKQREVVGFLKDTPHRQHLKPRPEMKQLVAELEDEI